ncbi:MAG: hypothetical protein NVSMB21_25540 [Vulcanimicrobiaceae bacterium]
MIDPCSLCAEGEATTTALFQGVPEKACWGCAVTTTAKSLGLRLARSIGSADDASALAILDDVIPKLCAQRDIVRHTLGVEKYGVADRLYDLVFAAIGDAPMYASEPDDEGAFRTTLVTKIDNEVWG